MSPEGAGAFEPIGPAPPVAPLEPGAPPLAILVDYDGTIALNDVSDQIMAEHVPGDWEAEAAKYDAGGMGSRRLMAWEIGLIDADPADLFATASSQPHDPGFVALVERARSAGIPIEVVSDGFGFFIRPALASLGLADLPVVTANTTFTGRRATIEFPNGHPTCLVCGTCKRERVRAHQVGGPRRRLHRRRRERPLRGGLRRRGVGQARTGEDLRRGRLAVPPLDRVRGDRRLARADARQLAAATPRRSRVRARDPSSADPRRGARASWTRRRTPGHRRPRNPARSWADFRRPLNVSGRAHTHW